MPEDVRNFRSHKTTALRRQRATQPLQVLHPGAAIDERPVRKMSAGDSQACSRAPVPLARPSIVRATAREERTLSDSTPYRKLAGDGATSPSVRVVRDGSAICRRASTAQTAGRDA